MIDGIIGVIPLKKLSAALLCCLMAFGVAGCSGGGTERYFDEDEDITIKVLYYDSDSFFANYGSYINMEFPKVHFVVVPMDEVYKGESIKDSLIRVVETEKPDVVFSNQLLNKFLRDRGLLYPLEDALGKPTLSRFSPHTLEIMRHDGGGEIDSLALSFSSSALYYNQDLLEKQGVEIPQDPLDWEGFSQLVQRINLPQSSLYLRDPSPASLFKSIGISEDYAYVDTEQKRVTLNTPGWNRALSLIRPIYDQDLINHGDGDGGYEDLFMKGSAALTLQGTAYYYQLKNEHPDFRWGVLPTPSSNPSQAGMGLENLISVTKTGEHIPEAVQFLRFLASDKMTKILSNSRTELSASLASPINQDETHPLHYLYTQSPDLVAADNGDKLFYLPGDFTADFDAKLSATIQDILDGKIGQEEGLREAEDYGNQIYPRS